MCASASGLAFCKQEKEVELSGKATRMHHLFIGMAWFQERTKSRFQVYENRMFAFFNGIWTASGGDRLGQYWRQGLLAGDLGSAGQTW